MSTDKFRIGDRVYWRRGSTYNGYMAPGTVTRVTPAGTVFAHADEDVDPAKEVAFRSGIKLDRMSDHQSAMVAWNRDQPTTRYVLVRSSGIGRPYFGYYAASDLRVETRNSGCVLTQEVLASILADTQAIGRWLAAEPQRPEGEKL